MYFFADLFFFLVFMALFVAAPLGVLYLLYKNFAKKIPISGTVEFPKHFGWITGSLVLAANLFIFDVFFWGQYVPSIGPGLFIVSAAAALYWALDKKKRDVLSSVLAGVAALAGLALMWRSSGFVHSINILLGLASLCALYAVHIYDGIRWEGLWFLRAKWYSFWAYLEHLVQLAQMTFKQKGKNSRVMSVVKTTLITTVILGVFVGLLVQADPVFAELVEEVLDEFVDRLFLSGFIALAAVFTLGFHLKTKKIKSSSFNILSFYDFAVPSALLIVLFGVFLSIQAHYLFGSHADFSSFDLTYSEYVRKGFKELLVAVFFGGLLNYLIVLKQKSEKTLKNVNILRGLNAVLVLELFALLASAFKRNIMYMEVYSLTRMRIVGIVILIWLSLFLLTLLIVNLSKQRKEWWIFAGMGLVTVLSVASLNVLNVDRMIADAEPPAGQRLDTFYLANLSADAAPAWPTVVETSHEFFESIIQEESLTEEQTDMFAEYKLSLYALENKLEDWKEDNGEYTGVLYFNISQKQARQLWYDNEKLFNETLPCLITEMRDYQLTNDVYFAEKMSSRYYDYEYPLTTISYRSYTWEDQNTLINQALKADAEDEDLVHQKYYDDIIGDEEAWAEFLSKHTPETCPL